MIQKLRHLTIKCRSDATFFLDGLNEVYIYIYMHLKYQECICVNPPTRVRVYIQRGSCRTAAPGDTKVAARHNTTL